MAQNTQVPPDGGIIYAETDMNHLFPEPLNALTSCLFLAIAIYWTLKLRGQYKHHAFLSAAIFLLYIGGIGGTVYHGLRRWSLFIMMDWLPIMILCVAAGVYFLSKLIRWYYALLLVALYGFTVYFLRMAFQNDPGLFININYALLASLVLLPVVAYMYRTKWLHARWVGMALISFVLALSCRVIDSTTGLDFGTHFLWHVFGAAAAFCMLNYIYLVNLKPTNS